MPPNDDVLKTEPSRQAPAGSHAGSTYVMTAKEGLIQPRLPKESIDILIAAAQSNDGLVLTVRTRSGYAVQVGGQNLVPSRSARDEARFKNAVEALVDHGFLAGNSQTLEVTHQGFLLADELMAVMRRQA